jgi:ribosome-binding protein aMBF1 (putative translation factor)
MKILECQHCTKDFNIKNTVRIIDGLVIYVCPSCKHANYNDNIKGSLRFR